MSITAVFVPSSATPLVLKMCRVPESLTSQELPFVTLSNLYKFCLLMWCVWMAYKARNIHSFYSESKYIGMAVYNFVCTSLITHPLTKILAETFPGSTMVIRIMAVNYIITFTVLILFYHKVNKKRKGGRGF